MFVQVVHMYKQVHSSLWHTKVSGERFCSMDYVALGSRVVRGRFPRSECTAVIQRFQVVTQAGMITPLIVDGRG